MGYYTNYTLEIGGASEERAVEVAGYVGAIMEGWMHYTSPGVWETNEGMKWYTHERELRDVSREFPDVLMKLTGHGEEPGDHWIKYFRAGKMQHCLGRVVFDDFNEEAMR